MSSRFFRIKCILPFQDIRCTPELRNLSENVIEKLKRIGYSKASELSSDFRICSSCRLKLALLTPDTEQCDSRFSKVPTSGELPAGTSSESLATVPSVPSASSVQSINDFTRPVNIEIFNWGIGGIQVSPIDISKLSHVHYPENKYREISESVKRNLFQFEPETEDGVNEFQEVLQNMKQKYSDATTSRSDKLLILSMLPKSWSMNKIMKEFQTGKYIATKAKEIMEKGITKKSSFISHGIKWWYQGGSSSILRRWWY